MITVNIPTAHGNFRARISARGLAGLEFPNAGGGQKGYDAIESVSLKSQIHAWQEAAVRALKLALEGHEPGPLPPLDWSDCTDFQRRVWSALLETGPGQTRTYSEIAAAVGRTGAARAVGSACGANPIPVLVPCHRVLAAGSRLGGFSGGLDWKRRLLAAEGVLTAELLT